jgi:hypothetical protein
MPNLPPLRPANPKVRAVVITRSPSLARRRAALKTLAKAPTAATPMPSMAKGWSRRNAVSGFPGSRRRLKPTLQILDRDTTSC